MTDTIEVVPATEFERIPHPKVVPDAERMALLVNPGFGRVFTDHMVTIRYSKEKGWHQPSIEPRANIVLDSSAAVLHYAQEIFEGLKAYRLEDGSTALFRPEANARRFVQSARRLAMAELPEQIFVDACKAIVRAELDWVPVGEDGALYLRPFMIASEPFLGVRPASEYLFTVIASSVGAYFPGGPKAVKLWISQEHSRAAPGGTGAAKCGGNYAASLAAQADAIVRGYDQVLFLDAVERRWIEELGGMNFFAVLDDGSIITPPLTGTILPGITRDSILTLARDLGIAAREQPYAIEQLRADAKAGRLVEAFACGTAAVVAPIAALADPRGEIIIGTGTPGKTTLRIRQALVDIQRGMAPDRHGWLDPV